MKMRSGIKTWLSVLFGSAVLLVAGKAVAQADLENGFVQPPPSAKPQVWWHWMNGNISREGIKADLEAMGRIGIGGATIFNVEQGEPLGPVKVLSPEWQEMTQYAIREANRVGVELTMHNCPGFTVSGGPWIKPGDSMQDVVWSETAVQGPATFSGVLSQPPTVLDYYRDIAVYAVPATPADDLDLAALKPKITSSVPDLNGNALIDRDPGTFVTLPRVEGTATHYVQFEFREPVTLASVRIRAKGSNMSTAGWVEVGDDGVAFRKVSAFSFIHRGAGNFALAGFAETKARFVRIGFTGTDYYVGRQWDFSEVEFGGARIGNLAAKAGYTPDPAQTFTDCEIPARLCIAPGQVVNLGDRMKPDGRLTWDVPAGQWTILRFGHTSTGKQIGAAPAAGRGLECDKMSAAAVESNFNAMMGQIIQQAGPLAGKSLKTVLVDSWEARCQNWTPAFRQEFQRRRGYDPLPWLPVLTGRAIASSEQSERFLWDFRRTIGDLIAENHYGTFQRLCARQGMSFMAEAVGIGNPTIAEQLQCKKYTDITMGEFWMHGGVEWNYSDSREAASAAHIYGKRIASAEAFTADPRDAKWAKAPFDLKEVGDLNFCRGINRFVIHRYAMQPWTNRAPGMAMGQWGTNFERTQTWWEQARAWTAYLQRCQYLLQQGLFVADIAYFYGEGAPNTIFRREPRLPGGYAFDAVNADVLLNRMTVRDGRLVLPDGMSYRLLLLPDSKRMTPEVLGKIAQLVKDGAVVLGPRPEKSPSLGNWPHADAEIARLASKVWGACDGQKVTTHAFGKGRVFWGRPLADVLKELDVAPDCTANGTSVFVSIHRRIGEADVYFVSNQSPKPRRASVTFRAGARAPELWHPESGKMEPVAAFTMTNGLVTVPLHFDPAGSVFVVFREPAAGIDPVQSFTRDGRDQFEPATITGQLEMDPAELAVLADGKVMVNAVVPGRYEARTAAGRRLQAVVASVPPPRPLDGLWTLNFPPNWGAPEQVKLEKLVSWSTHPEEGVKHFSGTATYRKVFDLFPEIGNQKSGVRTILDLGRVEVIAEVTLNGKDLGILWKPPFRLDVTEALRSRNNQLEVRVTNLWPNRLIGDAALPQDKRYTWTTFQPYPPDAPLLDSGLLGPVRLVTLLQVPAVKGE